MTRIKEHRPLLALLSAALLLIAAGCGGSGASANTTDSEESFLENLTEAITGEKYTVPEGTHLTVRLDSTISSESSRSGDLFSATLAEDLSAEGHLLAPAGTKVEGHVIEAKDSGRVKGLAKVVVGLDTLIINGEEYSVDAHPLTYQASKETKKDAATIAGSAAVGAAIGAITGGGKGAAIGAGVGGGAGTGYVLFTKGDDVELGREARLVFTLESDLRLPEFSR